MAYLTQYSNSVPVIKFNIDQTLMSIGQNIDMDICVPEDGIADHHAAVEAIKKSESYLFIIKSREDESLIELNGDTVSYAELQDGDWLVIGGVEFQFTDDGVNQIKETVVSIPATEVTKQTEKLPLQVPQESEALKLMKELKEEVESISTDETLDDARFSRRLNFF